MRTSTSYWWTKMPFVRLLVPLIAGILLQWQYNFLLILLLVWLIVSIALLIIYSLLPVKTKFLTIHIGGISIFSIMIASGSLITWCHQLENDPDQLQNTYQPGSGIIAVLEEPLVEKENSYKAIASIMALSHTGRKKPEGKIIIYFKKDSIIKSLEYGSLIAFNKDLHAIRSAGNPGAFDYRRYCYLQGITHQVYLLPNDMLILKGREKNAFRNFIFNCRKWVVGVIKKYIRNEKEQGLAQALLIGYKDDLDKNLVQSYSNTGVVHVIAISGLHLGLIYSILLALTRPLKKIKLARLIIIITALWVFSIIAGAQPSVLRSAVMFSCLALGEVISRKGSVFNSLALSAFILLCYNPFWLWDVGFQLSYSAVLSIICFYRPVYNWFFINNRIADTIWQLNAVTISAQLLTLPVSIYHFHQVPTLFLFSNLVAVPLSSLVLIGEILLCAIYFVEPVAHLLGQVLGFLIRCMNMYIERIDAIPFAVWKGLSINILQTILLTITIVSISTWFIHRKNLMLLLSLSCLTTFVFIRTHNLYHSIQQNRLIVYNIPKHSALQFLSGRRGYLIHKNEIAPGSFLWNFHLKPTISFYHTQTVENIEVPAYFEFAGKRILKIDTSLNFKSMQPRFKVDLLILSKNPRLYINKLVRTFDIKKLVIDSSVPAWKARLWKKDCDSLNIQCFDVSQSGAFIMNF